MKKDIKNKKELDELLSLAKKGKGKVSLEGKKKGEAHKYVEEFGIKAGYDLVSAGFIFWHYNKWAEKRMNKASRRKFFVDFLTMFERTRRYECTYYKIDAEPYNLLGLNYWDYRHEKNRSKEEKEQKKLEAQQEADLVAQAKEEQTK